MLPKLSGFGLVVALSLVAGRPVMAQPPLETSHLSNPRVRRQRRPTT